VQLLSTIAAADNDVIDLQRLSWIGRLLQMINRLSGPFRRESGELQLFQNDGGRVLVTTSTELGDLGENFALPRVVWTYEHSDGRRRYRRRFGARVASKLEPELGNHLRNPLPICFLFERKL